MSIIQAVDYPRIATRCMLEKWAGEIPRFPGSDPSKPEWQPTPVRMLDLTKHGLGKVLVKDESVNPTGTFKDRLGWEVMPCLYRDWAMQQLRKHPNQREIPRFSLLSSGSALTSLSFWAQKYALPPPRVLVDKKKFEQLALPSYADAFAVDLSSNSLQAEDILSLTRNKRGVDLTSTTVLEPHATFYDWLAFEVLNTGAKTIYVPYGSGRLMENILTWLHRCQRASPPDARLGVPVESLVDVSTIGCEPASLESKADKLTARFKPFQYFRPADVRGLIALGFAGQQTRIARISEEYIEEAKTIFDANAIASEYSGAAGLAGYLQDVEKDISVLEPVLVVNTGKCRANK